MFRNTVLATMILCLFISGQAMAFGLPKMLSGKGSDELKTVVNDRDEIVDNLLGCSKQYLDGLGTVGRAIGVGDELTSLMGAVDKLDLAVNKDKGEAAEASGGDEDQDKDGKLEAAMKYARQTQKLITNKMQA